jgi:hypothetical protein
MRNGELIRFAGEFSQSVLPLEDVLVAGRLEADGELVGFAAELVQDVLHQAVVLLPAHRKLRYRRSSGTAVQVQKLWYRSLGTQKLRYRSSGTEAQVQKFRYRSSGREAQENLSMMYCIRQ